MVSLEELKKLGEKHAIRIYSNPLSSAEDVKDFVLEGSAKLSFENGCMRMENAMDAARGQKANYVLWCPEAFPSDVLIEWDFKPVREPGLAILFFSAKGRNGEDLFDSSLQKRTGEYPLYHHGDINAFHVSYFRRKEPDERSFHTCNLRKSYGFYMAAQGGDPIPDVADVTDFYHLAVLKKGNIVRFYVNRLPVFTYEDDGKTFGPLLGGGKIGFRQLAPMIGEYANLTVWSLISDKDASVQKTYEQLSELVHRKRGNISLEECSQVLNYHPSYIWKILKKKNTTFTALVNQEKLSWAREQLEGTESTIAQIAQELCYSNPQNFIRFFSHYTGVTPGEYRKNLSKESRT